MKIYQFKYSEDSSLLKTALRDIQRGLMAEEGHLRGIEAVDLLVVTLASRESLEDWERELRSIKTRIKKWLTGRCYSIDARVEIIDLKRFRELSERLYGVDVTLGWKAKQVIDGKYIIGLINACGLRSVIDREELFSFNIRKFLGLRKGSVGYKILGTLKEEPENLWILNNGIVCLCTDFLEEDAKVKFQNFTIVNGAQTINTIARFLEGNPTFEEPIWVVAKVLKVDESEVEWAARITTTSNSQTPTSTRDLRAIDRFHCWIEKELQDKFNLVYVYKRGQRASRGSVTMKELAQAYIAFWCEEPHLAFGNPGQIFAIESNYKEIFPEEEIDRLKEKGTPEERNEFLVRRLLPWKIMRETRDFIKTQTGAPPLWDRKFRSLTYHMTWIYKKLLEKKIEQEGILAVYTKLEQILSQTLNQLFERLCDFFSGKDFPQCLKSRDAVESLKKEFLIWPSTQRIIAAIQSL